MQLYLLIVCIVVIMLQWSVGFAAANTYYVLPSSNTPCPHGEGEPCLTLTQYALKPNSYFSFNVTMILLPGDHTLNENFTLFQHEYVTILINETLLELDHTIITCINGASLSFFNISTLYFQGLNTIGCEHRVDSVKKFMFMNSHIQGQNKSGTGLVIQDVDDGNIVNTRFLLNTEGFYVGEDDTDYILITGGAMIILDSHVTILDCSFLNNSATAAAVPVIKDSTPVNIIGGAVAILNSYVAIGRSIFLHNSATDSCLTTNCLSAGGALFVDQSWLQLSDSVFSLNVATTQGGAIAAIDSNIVIHNCQMSGSEAVFGGGFYILDSEVSIGDSNMSHNIYSHIGAVMFVDQQRDNHVNRIFFNNCTFNNNEADFGSCIATPFPSSVLINSSTFYKNTAHEMGGVIYTEEYCALSIQHSLFEDNYAADSAGVIAIFDNLKAQITVHNSHFRNNAAENLGGVFICKNSSILHISASKFNGNKAGECGGVLFAYLTVTVDIQDNVFSSSGAKIYGGALFFNVSTVKIQNNQFHDNVATNDSCYSTTNYESFAKWIYGMDAFCLPNNEKMIVGAGGAVFVQLSTLEIESSNFTNSTGCDYGGAVFSAGSMVRIQNSTFLNNKVNCCGGAFYNFISSTSYIEGSTFEQNVALRGGAVQNSNAQISLINCTMHNNTAYFYNGAIHCAGERTKFGPSEMSLTNVTLTHNFGYRMAGAMGLYACKMTSTQLLHIHNNTGGVGVIVMFQSIAQFEGMTSITNNFGSVYAVDSTVMFNGTTIVANSSPTTRNWFNRTDALLYTEGGAMTIFKSNINIIGTMVFENNKADNGGAVLLLESILNETGTILVSNNKATKAGGGIYAYQSVLKFKGNSSISNNTAAVSGGAIHAASSSIEFSNGTFNISDNHARQGGGVFLELSSHFYVLKYWIESTNCSNPDICNTDPSKWTRVKFIGNSADYGGAIYVKDGSNSDTCDNNTPNQSVPTKECFYQNLAMNYNSIDNDGIQFKNTNFTRNHAKIAGGTLYGGLLDRCVVSPFAEYLSKTTWYTPVYYFQNITDAKLDSISSEPVRVCFCHGNEYDCSYHPPTLKVVKGKTFTIATVTVDQANHTVPSIVTCSLSSQSGGLSEGETRQNTTSVCTALNYTVFSPKPSETLDFYANGPCKDIGISKVSLNIEFLPCPIGFKLGQSNSSCICDPDLKPYITNCSLITNSLTRQGDFWIDYVDGGYVRYPHCPFDYCYPPTETVSINLNVPGGADSQCAHNHSGKLCGKCQPQHSLLLGGTRCSKCSNTWLLLLIPFALAGIALVVFLLVLNLTVAVGTIGGLVFYANIIAANYSTFFPYGKPTLASVFISWLNLDFGFETCFYEGMDAYTKTWLQFVFPVYIIILVIAIIVISDHSDRFAKLFTESGRNPIATLATLILLSYTKLLRAIIDALSFARLTLPNGTNEIVWLLDANVMYLRGKHIPLFIVALITAIAGLTYTLILLLWQVLLRCPARFILLRWMTNTKFVAFIDSYQSPYNEHHRYWTGLLLFLRTVIYLVSAVNVLGDPQVNLITIICVVGVILTLRAFLHQKPLETFFCNTLELVSLFNLLLYTTLTLYLNDSNGNPAVLEYTSACIAFMVFVTILVHHFSHFGLKSLRRSNPNCMSLFNRCLSQQNKQPSVHHSPVENTPPMPPSFPVLYDAPTVTEFNAKPTLTSTTQTSCTSTGNSMTYNNAQDSGDDSDPFCDVADETEPLLKV